MHDCSIAITGVATLLPGSITFRDFWRDIAAKKDFITEVPKKYWDKNDYYDPNPQARDKTYCYKGGFLGTIDFPAVEWGIPPKMLSEIDTSQLLSLLVAQHVLGQAQKNSETPVEDISVILGATGGTKLFCESACRLEHPKIAKAMRKAGIGEDKIQEVIDLYAAQFAQWRENTFPGLLINVITGRITNRLNLGGENCVVDAACASGLAAISYGIDKLLVGNTKMVVSGGVDTSNAIPMFMCFSKTPALSPTMDIRPFSKDADGTMLGEGIAMIAMKRLEDAERDGDEIYAVIRGIGKSSDGRAKSIYAPSPEGQVRALKRCYENAQYSPETVEFVEGHGTGTKAGDKSELETMATIFSTNRGKNYCAVGSVKSQYGHTKGAAGAVGMVKAVGALVSRTLLPTIKADNPVETEDTAFYVNTYCRPWFKNDAHPRRAGVSAFGFGGTNYHITVEEYTGKNRVKKVAPFAIIPVSGDLDSEFAALQERCENSYVFSEMADQLTGEYIAKFDNNAHGKAVVAFCYPNQLNATDMLKECVYKNESLKPVLTLPKQFNVFAGAEVACTFDAARIYWENLPAQIRQTVYPVTPPSGQLDISFNNHFEGFLKTIFGHFGQDITFGQGGVCVPEDISLNWFISTLAKLLASGCPINLKPLLDEFQFTYATLQKPKFSVPMAGDNYGRPVLPE